MNHIGVPDCAEIEGLLARLGEIGFREAKRYEGEGDVIGMAFAGSLGRGDVWEGSDIDLHVVRDNDETKVRGEAWKKQGFLVNVHHVSRALLEKLDDLDFFAESTIPDEVYGCKVVYDPRGVLASTKALVEERRFSDEVVAKKIDLLQEKVRRIDLPCSRLALDEGDLPTAMFYYWTVPIPHILFVHFRQLIRSASRFPELFARLCTEKGLNGELREYYGAEIDMKELKATSDHFVGASKEVSGIFREFSSSRRIEELPPSRAKWVSRMASFSLHRLDEEMWTPLLSNYEAHIKHGYLRGALHHMRANATQDIVSTMNRLYEGVFNRLSKWESPFSPFKMLRSNDLVTQRLYERIMQANRIHDISHEQVSGLIEERTSAFEEVNSVIVNH